MGFAVTATEKAAELRRLERRARELRREIKAARPKAPRPKAPGATKEERDAKWAVFVQWVRETVWMLSDHLCEHCGRGLPYHLGDLDHVNGGADRREYTRIEWCRRLCRRCHILRTAEKTENGATSAAYWREHMTTVRERRLDFHGPEKMEALREEQARRLEDADPRMAATWAARAAERSGT